MKDALVAYLVPLAVSLFFGAAVWALGKLSAFLSAKASGSKVAQVGAILTAHADAVVHNLEATVLPEVRAKAKDGLSPAEIASLRATALSKLKDSLGAEGLAAIQEVLGVLAPSLDSFLSGVIETRVAALPKAQPST